MTELVLQDLPWNLDELTELRDTSIFRLEKLSPTPAFLDKNLLQGIQIELSPNLVLIERTGYTLFDFLSDVGGLQGILFSAFNAMIGVLNYGHFEVYVLSSLFKPSTSARRG